MISAAGISVLAPTSGLSFWTLSSCFAFLYSNQRPKDRTEGVDEWIEWKILKSYKLVTEVSVACELETPTMVSLSTLPTRESNCSQQRRTALLGFFLCWVDSRPAVGQICLSGTGMETLGQR